MKKRGQATLWFIVELVGAVLIATIAIDIALGYSQGTIFEKLNIARDTSMQINALLGISGDAYIVNKNLHGYSLRFSDNKVEVFEDRSDQFRATHYFVKSGDQELDLVFQKPSQLVISKINGEIRISENIPNLS